MVTADVHAEAGAIGGDYPLEEQPEDEEEEGEEEEEEDIDVEEKKGDPDFEDIIQGQIEAGNIKMKVSTSQAGNRRLSGFKRVTKLKVTLLVDTT